MFEKNFTWAVIIICIFRVSVECKRNRTPVPRFHLSPFRVCALSPCSSSLRFYFFLSPDAAIEILLACSFEWFEVLKRHSITRHLRDPEESDAIAEEDGNDDDDDYDKDDDSDEGARRTSRAGKDRPNGSTRIVRRVLMDYPSTRKPVDQREFIVTAFTIDVYSYLDKRLDIDVTSETNTIISLTISDSA